MKVSGFCHLDPCQGEDQLIRIGGRLHRAEQTHEAKHPVILPANDPAILLLIRKAHENNTHQGELYIYSELRKKFCIISGRMALKRVICRCVECRHWYGKPQETKMSPLPSFCVNSSYAYEDVGINLAGPYHLNSGRHEKKAWILLLTDMRTRAVTLDVVLDLTSTSLINALLRFQARFSGVRRLYVTNNRGADRKLQEFFQEHKEEVRQSFIKIKIEFKFIPPDAPHHGGRNQWSN